MKVALVYDRINKIGGAEKIIERLHVLWPDAPLFTSVYSPKHAPWAKDIRVIPSFLQNIPFAKDHHEWFFWAMSIAFESFNFDDYDVVITVTSAQCKGIITKPKTLHINYSLTPTKYLYSQKKLHLKKNPFGLFGQVLLNPIWHAEQRWDQIAAKRPDRTIAISQTIANRNKRYYHCNVDQVIYPPVNTSQFQEGDKNAPVGDFYLLVSRLVPSKKIDIAIKAFNQLAEKLVIIGSGSEMKYLKRIAKPNISFLGQVDQNTLRQHYQNCKAFIFPSQEDFGIVMVEALAAGKPVIAYKKGGASEIITHEKQGLLFDAQSVSSIIKSVQDNQKHRWSPEELVNRARQFDESVFDQTFTKYVETAWQMHQAKI